MSEHRHELVFGATGATLASGSTVGFGIGANAASSAVGGAGLILNNGAPSQVQLYLPTVKDRSAESEWALGGYAQDTWRAGNAICSVCCG